MTGTTLRSWLDSPHRKWLNAVALAMTLVLCACGEGDATSELSIEDPSPGEQGGQTGALLPRCGPITGSDGTLTLVGDRAGFVVLEGSVPTATELTLDAGPGENGFGIIRPDGSAIALEIQAMDDTQVARSRESLDPGSYTLTYTCDGVSRETPLVVEDEVEAPITFFDSVELGETVSLVECSAIGHAATLILTLSDDARAFTDVARVSIVTGETELIVLDWGMLNPHALVNEVRVPICSSQGAKDCLPRALLDATISVEVLDLEVQPMSVELELDVRCEVDAGTEKDRDAGATPAGCSFARSRTEPPSAWMLGLLLLVSFRLGLRCFPVGFGFRASGFGPQDARELTKRFSDQFVSHCEDLRPRVIAARPGARGLEPGAPRVKGDTQVGVRASGDTSRQNGSARRLGPRRRMAAWLAVCGLLSLLGCASSESASDDIDHGGQTGALVPRCGPVVGEDGVLTLAADDQHFVVGSDSRQAGADAGSALPGWTITHTASDADAAVTATAAEDDQVALPSMLLDPGEYELSYVCDGRSAVVPLLVEDTEAPSVFSEASPFLLDVELDYDPSRYECSTIGYEATLSLRPSEGARRLSDVTQFSVRTTETEFVVASWGSLAVEEETTVLQIPLCRDDETTDACLPRDPLEVELLIEILEAEEQPPPVTFDIDARCTPSLDVAEETCSVQPSPSTLASTWLWLSGLFALAARRARRRFS